MNKLTLKDLELLDTASAYNGEQHKMICGQAALELMEYKKIEELLNFDIWNWLEYKLGLVYDLDSYYVKLENGTIVKANVSDFENIYGEKDFWITFYIISGSNEEHTIELKNSDYGDDWALTEEELL